MLNGFGASFTLSIAFSNILVSEISQLCYKGILRVIALGSSDGLSTLGSRINLLNQPIVVPVGNLSLGRIFNVIGSTIDGLMKLSLLSDQFSDRHPFPGGYRQLSINLSEKNVSLELDIVGLDFGGPTHFKFTSQLFFCAFLISNIEP